MLSQDRKKQFEILEDVKNEILKWAENEAINLYKIEYVVPFVEEDFSFDVWFFYQTDEESMKYEKDGTSERVKQRFLNLMCSKAYPEQFLSKVIFVFDSDENVQNNFEGSYFYRLR